MPGSRCSSTGSLHTANSSPNNSDDDDSDGAMKSKCGNNCLKDKRREAHTQAEQKRRDSIKKGYDELQTLIPTIGSSNSGDGCKVSKATTLQKSIDYIQFLHSAKHKQDDELASVQKEIMAMNIMKRNYEAVVAANHSQIPGQNDTPLSEQLKFQVFRAFLDSLYQTFDPSVDTSSFQEISGSVISWLEHHCKPQILREVMVGVLQQVQGYDTATQEAIGKAEGFPQ